MRIPLLPLILAWVLAEIAVFVLVGEVIGIGPTLGTMLAAMIGGILLLRSLGIRALGQVRADLSAGRHPGARLVDVALCTTAALLVVIPGLISSAAGLTLLLPPVRAAARRAISRRLDRLTETVPRSDAPRRTVIELDPGLYVAVKPREPVARRRIGGAIVPPGHAC